MAPGSASAPISVLLIDEDPAVGRAVRQALAAPRFSAAVASRALDGLRLAARQKPQLVIMELAFSQGKGLELAKRLMIAPETRTCALILHSAETSSAARLEALQAGAAGFIGKPCEGRRFVQRVEDIVALLYAQGLPHDVSKMPGAQQVLAQLRQLEESGQTGTLEAVAAGQNARLSLAAGRLLDAQLAGKRGEAALEALARRGDWQVRVVGRGGVGRPAPPAPTPLAAEPALDDFGADVPDEEATVLEPAGGGALLSAPAPAPAPEPMATVEVPSGQGPANWDAMAALAPAPGLGFDDLDDDEEEATQAAASPVFAQGTSPAPHRVPLPAPAPVPAPVAIPRPTGPSPQVPRPAAAPPPRPIAAPPPRPAPAQASLPPRAAAPPAPSGFAPPVGPAPGAAPDDEDDFVGFEEDEPTRQAPSRFRPIVDDDQPAREVVVPLPGAAAAAGAAPGMLPPVSAEARRAWLEAQGKPPLLLAIPNPMARSIFEATAKQQGYQVITATSATQAFKLTLARRPVAVICDEQLPDAPGRELLAGVRCDFRVRETPFIIVGVEGMSASIQRNGAAAVKPMLDGLATALAPRCALLEQLQGQAPELSGWVEPIGTVQLLRGIAAAKSSGRLTLRVGDQRNAEVIFGRGEICGVTVNAPQVAVGPLAMLQLLGFEWQEYVFVSEPADTGRVPLGELTTLVDTACRQNNTLLARVFAEGLKMPEVQVDRGCLDLYLQEQPPQRYELLIQLVEGQPPATIAVGQLIPEQTLKSVIFELRRRAVLRPQSLRPTRSDVNLDWTVFAAHGLPQDEVDDDDDAFLPNEPIRAPRRRRWPVVVVACVTTVVLTLGGLFLYRYVKYDGQLDRVLPWQTSAKAGPSPEK